jgi:hypothetical protein
VHTGHVAGDGFGSPPGRDLGNYHAVARPFHSCPGRAVARYATLAQASPGTRRKVMDMLASSHRVLLTAAIVVGVATTGCASSRSAAPASAVSAPPPTTQSGAATTQSGAGIAAQLRQLVLRRPRRPASYRSVPAQMHPISLAQETSNDSPRAAAIERAAYLGGYQAGYTKPGVRLLITVALAYKSANALHRVDTDPGTLRIAAAQMNGRLVPAPPGAPGADRVLIEGALPFQGHLLPVAYYIWREGRFAYAIFVEGRRAALPEALQLAAAQDAQDGQHLL